MERDNSVLVKSRCYDKLVWNLQNFAVMAKDMEDSFRLLRVTKIKKEVRELRATPPTPATLFTAPKENQKRPSPLSTGPRRQEVLHLCRRCSLTTLSDPFTYQMRTFPRHRHPNLPPSLLRISTATRKHRCRNMPRVAPRPCPICIQLPPAASPGPSHA